MNVNFPQSLKPEDVIEVQPPTVESQVMVLEALNKMSLSHLGNSSSRRYSYVLIVEKGKLVGILTERDIVRLTSTQIDFKATRVSQVMTKNPIVFQKTASFDIDRILAILRQNKIRHLPIVSDRGELEGIVTVNSICRALHPSNLLKFRRVSEAMTTSILEATAEASVLSLSQMMAEQSKSCVVIVSRSSLENNLLSIPIGIVTERDIVQFQLLGLNLAETVANTIMSSPLECVATSDSLMEVRQKMERLRVRRLVTVGSKGELQGIINQYDMLKVLDPTELFNIIETLQEELSKKTNQLQQEKELAQITLQSIGDAVITTDATGRIVNFNPMAERLTGWNLKEVRNKPLKEIFNIINEYTREPAINPVAKVLRENRVFGLANHTILIARDGTEYSIEDSAAPIRNLQGEMIGAVIVFHDVTESRSMTRQLSWQASHDSLTGLYNRREFEQKVTEAITSACNEGHQHALCYLDLDQFKVINDTCGHSAGDELLKQVTKLLTKKIRSTDILARLGGDEFGFLLYQCSLEMAAEIANNVRKGIEDFRFIWNNRTFLLGVSIGLVEITPDAENVSGLLNAADAACYVAKADGRNCVRIYQDNDVDLTRNLGERKWVIKLNQALESDYFQLYAQKIVPIEEKQSPNRYEILLRLVDEGGQIIPPGVFIPAAERYNLMPAIDCWVIEHFFTNYNRYLQSSKKSTRDNFLYAINLSGMSINSKRFQLFLKEQFNKFTIPKNTICFEITETAAIANIEIAARFIQELKELGCLIALDDFGSGMSSLTYLKNFSVDYLKIDGSFVKNIVTDSMDCATVEYFSHIARVLEIETVAEFVENEEILTKLKDIGVDYAQGYGIERPKPLVFE